MGRSSGDRAQHRLDASLFQLLVRPDGYVAFRSPGALSGTEAETVLEAVLRTVLGRTEEVSA